MLTLTEYIKENSDYRLFSIEGVNAEVQDKISESLIKSYDVDKLIRRIANHYDLDWWDFDKTYTKSKNRVFHIAKSEIEDYLDDKWLNDTLLLYGYYISKVGMSYVFFEPIFTDNITDIIQDDCHGKIYKIVSNELAKSIVAKQGLYTDKDDTMKSLQASKGNRSDISKEVSKQLLNAQRMNDFGYRMFTSRLFFFSAPDNKELQNAKQEVEEQIENKIRDGYKILEIDISKYNVNCYVDTYSGRDMTDKGYYLFYINAFFPLKLITFYEPDEFDRKFA